MNILYIGTLPPHPAGSAISCSQILVGLAGLGHVVRALAPITPQTLEAGDSFAARHPEVRVTRYVVPHFDTTPYIPSADEYRQLEHEQIQKFLEVLVAEKQPDIIFMGRETFAWHVPDLAREHGIPSILRLAGGTTLGILNGFYPEALARELLKQYRKVDLVIAVAQHLAAGLRLLGISRIQHILNAVDLKQFSPGPKDTGLLRRLAITDTQRAVVHVANLNARKRPLDIVNSAEKALKQDAKLMYLIVGDGPLRESMEEACRQKQIWDRFRYVGWVGYDQVPKYINLADVVAMPSEGEGMARVYLETQACGRLLLASDIPPAREVITHGETGLLFEKGNIDDLAAKTLLAAGDPRLRAAIGRKARERVQAHSIENIVAAYVATFEDVVRWSRAGC